MSAAGAAPFSEAEKHASGSAGSIPQQPQPPAKQRSCVTCRQRKVRCDKLSPCTNCRRADVPCVLSSAERPPRWARRLKQQQQQHEQQGGQALLAQAWPGQPAALPPALPQNVQNAQNGQNAPLPQHDPSNPTDVSAVLDRLRQLEALVRDLSAGNASAGAGAGAGAGVAAVASTQAQATASASVPAAQHAPLRERFGRLILDDDTSKRSRYVSSGFWSTINDELDVVRRETHSRAAAAAGGSGAGAGADGYSDDDDDDDDDSEGVLSDNDNQGGDACGLLQPGGAGASRSTMAANTSSGHSSRARSAMPEAAHRSIADRNAFLFGLNLQPALGRAADYRPLPSQIPFLFQVFVVNVNMLCQIVYVPTVNSIIVGLDETATKEPSSTLPPATEALLFAIYYAAVMSMEEEDVVQNFGMSAAALSLKYRIGLELSLASADFLNTSDLEVVQAIVIFLLLCRRYDSPRFVWMMTGLVIRMAMALGLHRDGSNFGSSLSPYDVELRRRVWYTICALDVRSSEDQGTDLTILPSAYDTRFPLSINDSDLGPDTKDTPRERDALTDMTYALLNFEVTRLAQCMMVSAKQASMSTGGAPNPSSSEQFLQVQNRMLEEVHQKLESRYLRHSPDTTSVIYWTSVTITRLFMAKMTLILNLPRLLQADKSASAPSGGKEDLRMCLLSSAIEVAEYNEALKTDKACRRWHWLCETYTQWHTIAFLLIETGRRPWDPAVERAWVALHGAHLIPVPPKKKEKEKEAKEAKEAKDSTSPLQTQPGRAVSMSAHSAEGVSTNTSSASESSQFFWLPLRRLMARARRHRASELARLRANTKAARDLEIAYDLAVADGRSRPSSNPGAVDAFRERWRGLVGLDGAPRTGPLPLSPENRRPTRPATTNDMSWDTLTHTHNSQFVSRLATGPAANVEPRFSAGAALRSFNDLSEHEYKSPNFPLRQDIPGSGQGLTGAMPAPNSIGEFVSRTSSRTPEAAQATAVPWTGLDPWQLSASASASASASGPSHDMASASGQPFVGATGVYPVNMDFSVDLAAEPAMSQLLFDEDLDLDMDVNVEPFIDWDNWFESAKGF